MIRFACECGRLLQASTAQVGSSAACPACERVLVVPDEAMATAQLERPHHVRSATGSRPVVADKAVDSATAKKYIATDLKARVSRKAIASVLVGTFLIVICLIGGIGDRSDTLLFAFLIAAPANLALALSAFRDINRNPVQLGGHRLATAGLLSLPLCLLVGLLLPPTCRLGASPNTEARMNLTMLGLAFHNFHQEHGHFPASAIRAPDGKPLLSWRVAILPYVEEEELYKLFHLDEPWDSPHNLTLLERLPAVFADASFKRFDGLTRFQVYVGPGTAFDRPDGAAVFFRDGAAKTVLITEGEQRVPWTKPIDLPFGPEVVLVRPHVRDLCTGKGSWVLSVDGEVHAVPVDCPEEVLRALITRNGGEEVEWPK